MKPLIILTYSLQLVVVFIVIKTFVYSFNKNNYIKQNPFTRNAYKDVDKEEDEYSERTDYR